ncbi:hypothetical protein SLEP1_g11001 [Rubroshorea leprosula]|uniref:Uncharacterized protein n=1 Tax=Rubroshorea leprosula TaxID=152421 RepID=A0AAV5IL99_9ROSI|nr:hypothetical protein SLEP1_g11001 [Rubroshorea leprosula]
MLNLCPSCSSSTLRAWPLQLMADLDSKCLSFAARAQVLHFMLDLSSLVVDLGSSCLSSAICARPLKLVADLGCKCLNSAARAQVLHFVLDLCSSCILHLRLVHFPTRDSAIIISDFYSSQFVLKQDACSSCSSISQLMLKQDACSSSLSSLIGLLRKAKWCWTTLLLPSWCIALSFAAAELDCFVAAELDRLVAAELGYSAAAIKLELIFSLRTPRL